MVLLISYTQSPRTHRGADQHLAYTPSSLVSQSQRNLIGEEIETLSPRLQMNEDEQRVNQ